MPQPTHPKLRAASPRRPAVFDPWNNTSKGHQHAENPISSSVGWRETREMKLQAQLQKGLSRSGGQRMYDLVGRGAKDDGLQWLMARDRIDGGEENARLNVRGELEQARGDGEPEKEFLKMAKSNDTPTADEVRAWDGKVRERICLDIVRKKRGRDEEEEEEAEAVAKKARKRSGGEIATELKIFSTHIMAAEDDDNVWEPDSQQESTKNGRARQLTHSGRKETSDQKKPQSTVVQVTSEKSRSTTIAKSDPQLRVTRENTPPSGQTRYTPPTPSPPPHPEKSVMKKQHVGASNTAPQSATSVIRDKPKPIFSGLTVHVSGSTLPLISDHALRSLLVQHGAALVMHLARRRLTHVVVGRPASSSSDDSKSLTSAGTTFAACKLQKEMHRIRSATGGPGIRFVSVEWVLESIKAGVRLSEARFGIGMDEAEEVSPNGPLSKDEREMIGSEVVTNSERRRMDRRAARAREMGNGKAANNAFQKGIARKSTAMPGAPPGVPSVRSLFLKQHRDKAWTEAGFVIKK